MFGHRFRLAPGVWNIQLRYHSSYDSGDDGDDGDDDYGAHDGGVHATSLVLR